MGQPLRIGMVGAGKISGAYLKTLARLDEIWPGHKTAPEDYAW